MKKIVLVIGDDKLGHKAVADILAMQIPVTIYLNRSVSPERIIKLLRRNIHMAGDFTKLFLAELFRKDTPIPPLPTLQNGAEILRMICLEKPDIVVCFRAGLILGKKILESGPLFLNLHYADLPEWGGLASIARALRAAAYQQNACLHRMTAQVDGGGVLMKTPYLLDPHLSYKANEERGFEIGLELLTSYLRKEAA